MDIRKTSAVGKSENWVNRLRGEPQVIQAPILQNLTPLALAVGLPRLQEMAREQNRDETRVLEWFLLQNMGLKG